MGAAEKPANRLASLLASRQAWALVPVLLLVLEVAGCAAIILRVPYTKIDWDAYMQEVRGFLVDGETDYVKLQGETGPLVYPGGFVWVFSALYYLTSEGTDVRRAQWIFLVLYVLNLAVVLAIYHKTRAVPLPALLLLCLSKRVHSLFVLRMFNDCVAMLLLYAAVLLFIHRKWWWGCTLYSLAVSVKMNVFLFAPGLFLLLLQAHGVWRSVLYISWCGVLQVLVGLPFLAHHPVSYLSKAFELGRVFMFKWTVNWAFLDPEVFVSKQLSVLLLLLTAGSLLLFAAKWLRQGGEAARRLGGGDDLSACYVVSTLFVSNFIGVAFARTLHYQFYSWYYHTLPHLVWLAAPLPLPAKLGVLGAVEWAFNVYPATPASSATLQVAHAVLLVALACSAVPALREKPGPAPAAAKKAGSSTRSKKLQ